MWGPPGGGSTHGGGHPRWGTAVQVMTTVGKELAAKGCKPAVATAVRKLTYRGKRKTAKERDLGKGHSDTHEARAVNAR